MPRKRKNWAHSVGSYGQRIRLSEDPNSGILYAEFRDPTLKSGYRTRSLRHRDRKRAIRWAHQQLAKLEAHETLQVERVPRLCFVLDLYLANQTPKKCESEQKADERRAELWRCYLGDRKDLRNITKHQWDSFIELRRSGAVNARGNEVKPSSRRPVRDNTVAGDLIFLRSVISWAMKWQTDDGRYLLSEDVTRGFEIPKEKNPRRPVATLDRYEAIMAVADQVEMEVYWGEKRVSRASHLREVLTLVHHTGRRISAVLQLRFEDLRLDQGPHGSLRWPADTDKLGRETVIPISRQARAAVDGIIEERPGIRGAYLFPAPKDFSQPVPIERAREWLLKAEELAGLEKQDGSLWHAYRRGWATARKHMPDVDVAAAGGWTDTATLKECYQHADSETMFKVVSQPMEIREA